MVRTLATKQADRILIRKQYSPFYHNRPWFNKINRPVKVIGDRDTTTNLRYKYGRNLNYPKNDVFEINKPEAVGLPRFSLSGNYIFSCGNDFFAYPNNYNYYVNYFKDTFQHGGVSLEEMLIPIVSLVPTK